MKCKDVLEELLDIFGTRKFLYNSIYEQGKKHNSLKMGETYFYNRLKQKCPIILSTKNELTIIFEEVLNGRSGYSAKNISRLLNEFFKSLINVDAEFFVLFDDDTIQLRNEKINAWLGILNILLDMAVRREFVEYAYEDFKEIIEKQKEAIERFCAGTHTEIIFNKKVEMGEINDRIREFYCGQYYCYYVASDAEKEIRGGKLRIYDEDSRLKAKLILRISNDYLLDDSSLDMILQEDDINSNEELKKYKQNEFEKNRYYAGRCEVYKGDIKVFMNHIRIDLNHKERGYSGFIILHKLDSTTQSKLIGCLGFLMNIPDSNSIYIRKLGISKYKFSLHDERLWKYISIPKDTEFLEISKSHKDNNHLFYIFVWENMIEK